jgi:hypothetical protein
MSEAKKILPFPPAAASAESRGGASNQGAIAQTS